MTFHADLWSGAAQRQMADLPTAVQDQIEACVRDICLDPHAAGEALVGEYPRQWYGAQAGLAVVVYEIDDLGEMVYIRRVAYRG